MTFLNLNNNLIEVTFKNVGQGDSIFLYWQEDNKTKIGIIDCKRYDNRNPILEELIKINDNFHIEFIIISHGHLDHYSGIIEVLNYCVAKHIKIENVATTLIVSQYEHYRNTLSRGEELSITNLLKKISELCKEGGIIDNAYATTKRMTTFSIQGFTLECLYPKKSHYDNLMGKYFDFSIGNIKTKPDLNYISSIFKISNNSFYCLFTSDCVIKSLDFILRNDEDIKKKKLHLAQAPHHGSVKNHNKPFWDNRKRKEKCPVVFSVGKTKHNLPDKQVVVDFNEMSYKILSTNQVNGINDFVKGLIPKKNYSNLLNNFSTSGGTYSAKPDGQYQGDKKFTIDNTAVTYVA